MLRVFICFRFCVLSLTMQLRWFLYRTSVFQYLASYSSSHREMLPNMLIICLRDGLQD
uniref:Uncharacterized protein n=1 Tax=Arundo donax TaxID=35708 RepID=A0A0A8YN62_ARUDO